MRDSKGKNERQAFLGLPFPWVITAVAAILLLVSAANVQTFGVFFKPMADELGWSRTAISGALSVRSIVYCLLAGLVGSWADRYGPRKVLLLSCVLYGIGFLLIGRVTALWQLYLTQGLLMGIANTAPWICLVATVAKWHNRRRGLALGITAAGGALSTVIFPPLAARLIETADWRFATEVFGLAALAISIPFSLLIRDPPGAVVVKSGSSHTEKRRFFDSWRVLMQFLSNRTFLAIVVMFCLFNISTSLISAHFVNYATDVGISVVLAASMMSALGIANSAGRLLEGFFSDRTGIKAGVVVCFGLALLSLILMDWNASSWMLWMSVVLAGFSFGGMVPLIPGILSERFGTERLATTTGAAMGIVGIGAAIGPYMGGFIFDLSGSYSWALALSAAFLGVALVLALLLGPGEHEVAR